MKKTTKIILIIAGISVALGLVISIVAAAAGGTTIAKEVVFGNGLPSLFVKKSILLICKNSSGPSPFFPKEETI